MGAGAPIHALKRPASHPFQRLGARQHEEMSKHSTFQRHLDIVELYCTMNSSLIINFGLYRRKQKISEELETDQKQTPTLIRTRVLYLGLAFFCFWYLILENPEEHSEGSIRDHRR